MNNAKQIHREALIARLESWKYNAETNSTHYGHDKRIRYEAQAEAYQQVIDLLK